MKDIYPFILEALNNGSTATIVVSGISMQPMLYNGRDTVTLSKPKFPLKKYDLPLFRLDDGRFILHRVIDINKDGTYICRGDNRWESEDGIRDDQIIGVVTSFVRNGKRTVIKNSLLYFLYTRTWKVMHHFKKYYKYFKR